MGFFSTVIAYQLGKRRGRKQTFNLPDSSHEGHPNCLNYASFCYHFGSCDGQECEFDEE